jgi:hypothetical protein
MMRWIYEYAFSQGCIAYELDCYVTNHAAQKYLINEGYQIRRFHYLKKM